MRQGEVRTLKSLWYSFTGAVPTMADDLSDIWRRTDFDWVGRLGQGLWCVCWPASQGSGWETCVRTVGGRIFGEQESESLRSLQVKIVLLQCCEGIIKTFISQPPQHEVKPFKSFHLRLLLYVMLINIFIPRTNSEKFNWTAKVLVVQSYPASKAKAMIDNKSQRFKLPDFFFSFLFNVSEAEKYRFSKSPQVSAGCFQHCSGFKWFFFKGTWSLNGLGDTPQHYSTS